MNEGRLSGIQGCRELLLRLESGMEPIDNFGLVFRAGENAHCSAADRNDGVPQVMTGQPATRAADTPGGTMLDEFGSVICRVPTNGGELCEMLCTADNRDRDLI